METTFLQKLAKEINDKHPDNLDKLCFVFPSKRSGLFFKKELAKIKGNSFWAPQILTIESFIEELSGLQVINPLEQLFQLFEIHKKLDIQPQLPFEKFIDPAKIILADFNDIDMALADADNLFQNVKDYVELQNWDPSNADETSLAKKYLEAFVNLPIYYKAYQEKLISEGKAYQGLVYRNLKKQIETNQLDKINEAANNWEMIYVAGLNALTTAEKWVFDWFANQGKLAVYFEADSQMIDDADQESGKFIRGLAKEQGNKFKWAVDHLSNSTKNISSYGVNGNLSMARTVGEIFEKDEALSLGNETAIILADENLLMPVLESLPARIGDVNVTLGFPLGLTSFMSFAEQLFGMQKMISVRNGIRQFYFKDVMKVLTNPVLVYIYGNETAFEELSKQIVKLNKVWIDEDFLFQLIAKNESFEDVKLGFSNWQKEPLNSLKFFNQSINKFQENLEGANVTDDVLTEQLYFFKTSLLKLQHYIDSYAIELSLDALKRIFKQVVSPMQVPFSGEPLAGIQIMGLLETRLLSFKNIVFISVNEGVIPAKGGGQSFLPFNLRSGFKIQTHQDRESLFAYHFYRLLSQAENISLIYDTSSEGVGSKEKSRFIRQIEQEWPEKSENISFTEYVGVFEDEKLIPGGSIEKTPEVIANIKRYLTERGLSPSGLNNFMESPVDFYYKNVIGVYEPKSVDEDVEHNVFGTIVHNCLEAFYIPFEKQVLKADKLTARMGDLDEIIKDKFSEKIPNYGRGKHYLSFYSVKNYVYRFIQLDIDFVKNHEFPITLDANELDMYHSLKIDDVTYKFKGVSDRVETRQGVKYIIDYKTGSVSTSDLKISHFDDLLDESKKYRPKFVQLLMYAWLAHKQMGADKIVTGIYTLRDTKLQLLKATVDKETIMQKEDFEGFEVFLTEVVRDMLDANKPLELVSDYTFALFK